jgi:hypothetical protein
VKAGSLASQAERREPGRDLVIWGPSLGQYGELLTVPLARPLSVSSGVQLLWSGSSECPTLNACAGGAGCLLRLEFGSARVEHHP